MRQRLRRWMIVVTLAMTLGMTIPQAAFAADEPLHPDSSSCGCDGGRPPRKKCAVSSNRSDVLHPAGQCGW